MMDAKIKAQIEVVIDAASNYQSETGPDADYRRAAKKELDDEKQKLAGMIDAATKEKT